MSHRLGSMQKLPSPMRRFKESDVVDYCIVGVGSAGGVLVQRLARAGFRVVGLEAGPFGTLKRIGSATKKAPANSIGTIFASPAERIHWRWARITAARASEEVRFTGPPLRRAFILPIFGFTPKMASAPIGPCPMGT